MTIDEIIKVCDFIAGIPSRGLEQLAEEFAPLPKEQINKRDPYNADNTFLGFRARPLQRKSGVRYDGEKEDGKISLFEK